MGNLSMVASVVLMLNVDLVSVIVVPVLQAVLLLNQHLIMMDVIVQQIQNVDQEYVVKILVVQVVLQFMVKAQQVYQMVVIVQ